MVAHEAIGHAVPSHPNDDPAEMAQVAAVIVVVDVDHLLAIAAGDHVVDAGFELGARETWHAFQEVSNAAYSPPPTRT